MNSQEHHDEFADLRPAAGELPAWSRAGLKLFLLGFLTLFLELFFIRYLAGSVWNLGYFPNLVLLSAFIGMGSGFVFHQWVKERHSGRVFQGAFAAAVALILFVSFKHPVVPGMGSSTWHYDLDGDYYFSFIPFKVGDLNYVFFALCFVAVALVFAGISQRTAKVFRRFAPLNAYTLDILGSCAGILSFIAISALRLPAWSWFALFTVIFVFAMAGRWRARLVPVLLAGAAVFVMHRQDAVLMRAPSQPPLQTCWSPYQKIEYVEETDPSGSRCRRIFVNGLNHQEIHPVPFDVPNNLYLVPYRHRSRSGLPPYQNVLIIGAGSGNDVTAALHGGAAHVDAVEIDPVIARLGRDRNPSRPYADPRVTVHIDDGRAFLTRTRRKYDLIIFALTDSLVKASSLSQLRLENYLFTRESVARAAELLNDRGHLVFYNYYRLPFVADRIYRMAGEATGSTPQVLVQANDFYMICGEKPAGGGEPRLAPGAAPILPTDDWPFLYLEKRGIPGVYLKGMAGVCGVIVALLAALHFGTRKRAGYQAPGLLPVKVAFVFMGIAFLLLETKSVIQFSLLFGTTWLNNSLIFLAVLVSVLAANWTAQGLRSARLLGLFFALLIVSALGSVFCPLHELLRIESAALRFVAASLLTFSPIYFANLIFSLVFKEQKIAEHIFGWNLLGATFGGVLEYSSMALGYNALSFVVVACYSVVFVLLLKARRQRAAVTGGEAATESSSFSSSSSSSDLPCCFEGEDENESARSARARGSGDEPRAAAETAALRWRVAGVCVFLLGLVGLVFGQTLGFGFVNCDDSLYVFENARVMGGLTLGNVVWAFTHFDANFYHPLTMLSLMLDYRLHGLNAGGYHLTNVLLHAASAIVLFLALGRLTSLRPANGSGALASAQPPAQPGSAWQAGAVWPSAFVAAVFAIHPLRAESVAWVAERKDVLSALFFMLTLWAYARYVQSSKFKVQSPKAAASHASRFTFHVSRWYGLCLLFFALSLLSKPLAVTLPFLLLLLDYWPLKRVSSFKFQVSSEKETSNIEQRTANAERGELPVMRHGEESPVPHLQSAIGNRQSAIKYLLLEKTPFLLLAAAACVVAVFAQGEAVTATHNTALSLRFANAAVAYAAYLRQLVWPSGLAMYYPYPEQGIPPWEVAGALVLLAAISLGCVLGWRKCPYLLVGWLWYLGMLVPMIGIVQVGMFARADRFTYLPQIGLVVALTWGAISFVKRSSRRKEADHLEHAMHPPPHVGGYAGYEISGLAGLGAGIIAALSVACYVQTAFWRDGETLWRRSIACTANNAVAHNNLGFALFPKGELDEAMVHFRKALAIMPDYLEARYNLATALLQSGRAEEAVAEFRSVLQLKPDADAENNLGSALLQLGRVAEAVDHFRKALELKPAYAGARFNLGNASMQQGQVDEAIAEYQKAVQIKPDHALACRNLGYAFAQNGNLDEAIRWLKRALEIAPENPEVQNNLAWLLATTPQAALRNGAEAVELAGQANRLTGGADPAMLHTLAAAYAEAGRFDEAVRTARQAIELAEAARQPELVQQLTGNLKLYEAGQPFREGSQTNAVEVAP